MYAYWNSPLGIVDMYNLFIGMGIVSSLIVQMVLLLRIKKSPRYLPFILCYFVLLYIGRYASAFIRCVNDGAFEGKINLPYGVLHLTGTHFLGHVIVYVILFFPIAYFLREFLFEFFGIELCDKKELVEVGEIIAVGLPVQHIFNRLACLLRGCCYGIEYSGPFSIELPYNVNIDYSVFPSQILEIICMIIMIIILLVCLKKRKPIFGYIMMGFSVTFFISEFFLYNLNDITHFGLTYIQIFSIVLMFAGKGCNRYLLKMRRRTDK